MNKIFVSDMDGTFLDTSSNVPHDFNDYLSEIKENDMHFVLASGRALYNMKHKMVNYLKDIDFISDNGAFVSVEGKTIYKSVMDKEIVLNLIEIGIYLIYIYFEEWRMIECPRKQKKSDY